MKNWLSKLFGRPKESGAPPPGTTVTQAAQGPGSPDTPQPAGRAAVRSAPGVGEPALPGDDWPPGQSLLDGFTVEKTLGEGGMGKVYLVRSSSTGSRFAVKRAKGLKESDRRNFLAELQTWIDLPEHANLLPCRFFRTVGQEILIFAEYVEGGSLEEWIVSRRLYQGSMHEALERMLDVAIQFAWGLHCVHELGLVHQDVKPGNVLMCMDRQAAVQGVRPRVTDYGLARGRAAAGETCSSDPSRGILVSSGGGTPAYWSPEQAQGLSLTGKTDMWSWGVSVLEMFLGEVTWRSGQAAAEVLERHLQQQEHGAAIRPMPDGLADLLSRCFRAKPEERLASLATAVDRLKVIYQKSVGAHYARALGGIPRRTFVHVGIKARRSTTGTAWTDPNEWVQKALEAAGRDPAEAAAIAAQRGATRRGELVAELAGYDQAKILYERLVRSGRKELEYHLAALCADKALVHITAGDGPGTLQEYERSIMIRERLVNQEGRRELAGELARVYLNKANAASDLGDIRAAVPLYDSALVIWERLVNLEGRPELANDLAMGYMNKANVLSELGDNLAAVALCDQAIAIRERLVNLEGHCELANDLAMVYGNKAKAVWVLGNTQAAVRLYDQAIVIRERLVNQEGHGELADDLATDYMNKASAISTLGDKQAAVAFYNQAIVIRERLVNQEGHGELANDLAVVYMNKGIVVSAVGDIQAAVALFDQAIAIRERLVNLEGRRELANDLAVVYVHKGIAVSAIGDIRAAVALYDQAIAIRERLVNLEGRRELANDLVAAYVNKANVISATGEIRAAVALYDQAIAIEDRLVSQEGRAELANDLATVYMDKANTVRALGDIRAVLAMYDQVIAIRERLVNQEGRRELANDLAMVYLNKAVAISDLGDYQTAVALFDRAIAIRERLVNQEGRRELAGDLARVQACRGKTLAAAGEVARGLRDMRSARSVLQFEVARTGRIDLKQFLDWLEQLLARHSVE